MIKFQINVLFIFLVVTLYFQGTWTHRILKCKKRVQGNVGDTLNLKCTQVGKKKAKWMPVDTSPCPSTTTTTTTTTTDSTTTTTTTNTTDSTTTNTTDSTTTTTTDSTTTTDQGISEILTKTGDIVDSRTNDNVNMQVCDMKGRCCTTALNDPAVNNQETGNVDTFSSDMLGDCSDGNFYGDLTATLSKDGSDGWFVEWAEIKLDDGRFHTCMFNSWLDNDPNYDYTNSVTVNCDEEDPNNPRSWCDAGCGGGCRGFVDGGSCCQPCCPGATIC